MGQRETFFRIQHGSSKMENLYNVDLAVFNHNHSLSHMYIVAKKEQMNN